MKCERFLTILQKRIEPEILCVWHTRLLDILAKNHLVADKEAVPKVLVGWCWYKVLVLTLLLKALSQYISPLQTSTCINIVHCDSYNCVLEIKSYK